MKKLFLIFLVTSIFFSSCTQTYRSIRYFTPDIDEFNAFPQEIIKSPEKKYRFNKSDSTAHIVLKTTNKDGVLNQTLLEDYLKTTSTTAFLIIKNDTIIFEKYYQGFKQSDITTLFSVTKSVTSLLIGIAIDEGYIKSVNDPVTNYLPELNDCDPNFKNLTIEHLLNFQAGFDFNESYVNPFAGMARLYYGNNQLKYLKKLKFKHNPGEVTDYNSATTAFLGLILESATHKSYAKYLEEKVWKPLGMQYDASISLDDKKHRSAKAYAGLNASAIDLAKIGRLYLNEGTWNGKQIVSKDWVVKSKTPMVEKNHIRTKYKGYQNQWYNKYYMIRDSLGSYNFKDTSSALNYAKQLGLSYYNVLERKNKKSEPYYNLYAYYPQFNALGILNQILFIDPERNIIMVRLGKDWDWKCDYDYIHLMYIKSQLYPKAN